jgi:hypothetical protein
MPQSAPQATEEQLIAQLNKKLQARLAASRFWYLLLALFFVALSVLIAFAGFWMMVLIVFVVALICLLQFLDANDQLREARHRPRRRLLPDFSVLLPRGDESATKAPHAPQ